MILIYLQVVGKRSKKVRLSRDISLVNSYNVFVKSLFLIIILSLSGTLYSYDHSDGNGVSPSAEITNIYAWLQNKDRVNLIMNVHPNATTSSQFSESVSYVFHVNSSSSYGGTQTKKRIVCQFDSEQKVSCLLETSTLIANVDASAELGATNDDGSFRIFTGLRNDPHYLDEQNFNLARTYVRDNIGSFTVDSANCPDLSSMVRSTAVNTLTGSAGGEVGTNTPGSDSFVNANVLSIVIQINKELLGSGEILGVWGSTHDR